MLTTLPSEVLSWQVTSYAALEMKHVFKTYFKLWKMIEMPLQIKGNQQKRQKTDFFIYKDVKQCMLKLFLINIMIDIFVLCVKK